MYRLYEKCNQKFYARFYFIISSVNQKKNGATRNKMQPKDTRALLRHLNVMSFIKKKKKDLQLVHVWDRGKSNNKNIHYLEKNNKTKKLRSKPS